MATTATTQLLLVTCDAGSLFAMWQRTSVAGQNGYRLYLTPPQGAQQTRDVTDGSTQTTWPIDLVGQSGYTLSVAVLVGGEPGPLSTPLPLITLSPIVLSMVYDLTPSAQLSALWRAVAQNGVTGYVAVLSDGAGGQWTQRPAAPQTAFVQTLDTTKTYQLTLRATGSGGVVQGPVTAPLTAITLAPQMQSMAYAVQPTAALDLIWAAVQQSAVSGYVAVLSQVGSSNQWTQTPQTPQAQFQQTLDPAQNYQATVRATGSGGVVQGPAAGPLTAITATPALTLLDYNPNSFIVSWNTVTGAGISGYEVTIADSSSTSRYPTGNVGQSTLQVTLNAALTYTVTVRAVDSTGIINGPPSPSLAPLLTAPTNPALSYTGTAFSAGWAADPNPATTGYVVQLLKNGGSADQSAPTAPPATFSDAFDSGAVYATWVRSTGAQVRGPWTSQAPGPYRSTATLTYDSLGRMKTVARANAVTSTFAFDLLGNLLSVVDTTTPAGK